MEECRTFVEQAFVYLKYKNVFGEMKINMFFCGVISVSFKEIKRK